MYKYHFLRNWVVGVRLNMCECELSRSYLQLQVGFGYKCVSVSSCDQIFLDLSLYWVERSSLGRFSVPTYKCNCVTWEQKRITQTIMLTSSQPVFCLVYWFTSEHYFHLTFQSFVTISTVSFSQLNNFFDCVSTCFISGTYQKLYILILML